MIFLIFILLFTPALINAIFEIRAENKRRKRALKKWAECKQEESKPS